MPQIDFPQSNFNITKLDDGTTFTADLTGKELMINNTVTHDNTTINSNNILLKNGVSEELSSRVKIDANSTSNNFAIEMYGLNNDPTSQTLLSTRGTTNSLVLQDPPVSYIQANSVANIDFTVGGHYADYTDGSSNINRIYTGFYRDTEPSIGAFTATSQNDLLYPQNSTPININIRSPLSMGTNEIISEANITTVQNGFSTGLTQNGVEVLNGNLVNGVVSNTFPDGLIFKTVVDAVVTQRTVYGNESLSTNVSMFDITIPSLTLDGESSTTAGQVIASTDQGKPIWKTPFISGRQLVEGTSNGVITAIGVSATTPIVATLFSNNSEDISNVLTITSQTTNSFSWRTSSLTHTGAVINWIATLI
jgi:hypothetical protein